MKARHQRLILLLAALSALGLAAWLVLGAFQKNLVFFFSPTQVWAGEAPAGRAFRIGGLVEAGSLRREADGLTAHFVVTDLAQRVAVRYRGPLPDLFKEGKGVVAQGRLLSQDGHATFVADEVLAKHDENYMPPEAAAALAQAASAAQAATAVPTAVPTAEPTAEPTAAPTAAPSSAPAPTVKVSP